MNQDKVISDYCKMRDELLINFEKISDSELLQKLLELNGENIPSSPEVARIGLHKARLYSNNIPIMFQNKNF